MRAVLLVGHGSLRAGSGAAMIRLAARLREAGVAPLAGAGFLNYSRPTLAEGVGRLAERGASAVVVAPYFLIPGYFTAVALPRALEALRGSLPALLLHLAPCLGDHRALAELVALRAAECPTDGPPPALLLLAHGSPDPAANRPIEAVAARLAASGRYSVVATAFLDLNPPAIPEAIAELVASGQGQIVAVPYFLQLGGHVAEDLPAIIAQAQKRHPDAQIQLAPHLGYHPLLAEVIAERVGPSCELPGRG